MHDNYQPDLIETEAQAFWEQEKTFEVIEDPAKEKFYCLCMFPYPSGYLHMGHVRNYTLGDIISRYQRMLGKNVLQPMGWDAFGLPAENAAIKHQVSPAKWTYENTAYMRQQFQRLGFGYDWRREITTCKLEYYRWEQWFFIQLYKKGLVYKKSAMVNWDPVDNTVLANEQVINGRGWRSDALVERREIPQWFLKITAYADQLLNDLSLLGHWPEQVRTMQHNWIGRSEGATIKFTVPEKEMSLEIFTTRADTLFGVTYLAISPQHPLALKLGKSDPKIQAFIDECKLTPVAEAAQATMEKRGINTGCTAEHPISHKPIPIWIANFVVMEYGTGAVMSVPAHDERDHAFAKQYQLPIKPVIKPFNHQNWNYEQAAFTEYGELIDSSSFSGISSEIAIPKIISELIRLNHGQAQTHYRLRDWSVSRQRYWGTPIPFIHCDKCGEVPMPEADLPVILPENIEFTGTGSPLKNIPEFYNTTCPRCQAPAVRETDTFDTFMESSWYYARYASYDQSKSMLDDRANYWLSVDQYIGGIEHAVLHLLYARFFHKLMRDEGLIKSAEPFTRLLAQGMVLKDGSKMSKSKGNTVDPKDLIQKYGADTVRLFIAFAAPPEQSLEWSDSGVEGAYRYLKRVWAFANQWADKFKQLNTQQLKQSQNFDYDVATKNARRQLHDILRQINFDYERQQFNTVVSGCMKLMNLISEYSVTDENQQLLFYHEIFSILLRTLAPIIPHLSHYLWRECGYGENVLLSHWPLVDEKALISTTQELVVQVNGKLRGKIIVPSNASQAQQEQIALADSHIKKVLGDMTVKKVIVVPGKLINIVVG